MIGLLVTLTVGLFWIVAYGSLIVLAWLLCGLLVFVATPHVLQALDRAGLIRANSEIIPHRNGDDWLWPEDDLGDILRYGPFAGLLLGLLFTVEVGAAVWEKILAAGKLIGHKTGSIRPAPLAPVREPECGKDCRACKEEEYECDGSCPGCNCGNG